MITGRLTRHDGRSWLEYRPGSGTTVEIVDIHVDPARRRSGTGRALVAELRALLPRDTLLVFAITRVSNVAACEFYEALGFRVVGRLHLFYKERGVVADPRDGYLSGLMYGLDIQMNHYKKIGGVPHILLQCTKCGLWCWTQDRRRASRGLYVRPAPARYVCRTCVDIRTLPPFRR